MEIEVLNIRQSLNKAYLKVKPTRSQIELFKFNILHLFNQISEKESEEYHKNIIAGFLKNTYYNPNHYINTKGRTDLVIHNGKDAKSSVGVIIETKRPGNKTEMPSNKNLNVKAVHELVLYYLRERIKGKNLEIKYLIATDLYEWFIFNSQDFEKLFANNKRLVKYFEEFEEGTLSGTTTDFFYNDIVKPFITELDASIPVTYLDIRAFETIIKNESRADDNQLIGIYKILSPEHLLKLPFSNDSNTLDRRFYNELLHIIGLEEKKEGSKKLIGRKPEESRNTGSLIENAINILRYEDCLNQLEKPTDYGSDEEERLYHVALELSITWINRILFLKLLEGQLVRYHQGDRSYKFFNPELIPDYDTLNKLFFHVLAVKENERGEHVKDKFRNIPYLNSSLFEPNELEHKTIRISNLEDDYTIPILSSTIFKDTTGKKISGKENTIHYLLNFLDAYDFSSEGAEDISEENKTLINASVLGLIFEKINGYKDGSFFTPGFITMYMCRETIRRAVVQKFNDAKGLKCKTIEDLYNHIADKTEANSIINSLKICDPAVGSGHFLVSALNEIITIKSELKILADSKGKVLRDYHIEVINDELVITDENGEFFEYHPKNPESQRIQETLFHEKQTIIENCLFGVDINQNSVKICRLRLWIELLKNAYYKPESGLTELETLPNIDINIKCGNSLISRYPLDADIKTALAKSKWNIDSYRLAVMTYRNAENKEQKASMRKLIEEIKSDFESEVALNDKRFLRLNKLRGKLIDLTGQTNLYELSKKEKTEWEKKVKNVTDELNKIETELEEIKSNKIYEHAFEWRFEFPEVLNNNGDFVGFDVVIGNPPYMLLQNLEDKYENALKESYITAKYKGDTFATFIERSLIISTNNSSVTLIVPYVWLSIQQHFSLRKLVLNSGLIEVINLPQKVFESADLDTTIISVKKGGKTDEITSGKSVNNEIIVTKKHKISHFQRNHYWEINLDISEIDHTILNIIESSLDTIQDHFEVSQGYIPYRRSDLIKEFGEIEGNDIVDNRLWHSESKISEEYLPEIQGKDISRYSNKKGTRFFKYGKHVAGYVNPKFFTNPRILIMEITRGNYYLISASYVNTICVNNPSIINIIHPSNNRYLLHYLLSLVNSRLYSWYHIKRHSKSHAKTSIPKILVREVKNLPFKFSKGNDTDKIVELSKQITKLKKDGLQTSELEKKIDFIIYGIFGLSKQEIRIVEEVNSD